MQSRTILVVDDEPMIAEDLCESLQEAGYRLLEPARTGAEALRQVQHETPDLVLMDINLEGALDGIATAHAIQASADCAVIYLTANADSETLQRARQTHPFGYLLKPFRERELHAMVEISLYRHAEEKNSRWRQQIFEQTMAVTPDAIVVLDACDQIQFMNSAAETLLGWSLPDSVGHSLLARAEVIQACDGMPVARMSELQNHSELIVKGFEQTQVPVRAQLSLLHDRQRHLQGRVLNLTPLQTDATELPQNMLTLCASCRDVRTPEGDFSPLDSFLRKYHQTRFSHGICPTCFEQLYPQYFHRRHEA